MKDKYINYVNKAIIGFLAAYLSFSSFILVKILTNDIILNSYKAYSIAKLQWNVLTNKAENIYDKGKLLFTKLTNKEKAEELEKKIDTENKKYTESMEKMKKELEFNQIILSWLPYIISIIIFILTYTKLLRESEEFILRFRKN